MKMKKRKFIFIPIEIYAREIPSKLILAVKAAYAGYSVIVGRHYKVEEIAMNYCDGVYLGTTMTRGKFDNYLAIKENGGVIVGQDEEGLVYYNEDNFLRHRVVPEVIDLCSVFCTWGNNHTNLVKRKVSGNNISELGNIRMEVLKSQYLPLYEKDVMKIRSKYGRFVLINTNLAAYNHVISWKSNLNNIRKLNDIDDNDEKFYADKINHQKNIMDEIKNLARILEEKLSDRNINIVIRPHPAENINGWDDVRSQRINVVRWGGSSLDNCI